MFPTDYPGWQIDQNPPTITLRDARCPKCKIRLVKKSPYSKFIYDVMKSEDSLCPVTIKANGYRWRCEFCHLSYNGCHDFLKIDGRYTTDYLRYIFNRIKEKDKENTKQAFEEVAREANISRNTLSTLIAECHKRFQRHIDNYADTERLIFLPWPYEKMTRCIVAGIKGDEELLFDILPSCNSNTLKNALSHSYRNFLLKEIIIPYDPELYHMCKTLHPNARIVFLESSIPRYVEAHKSTLSNQIEIDYLADKLRYNGTQRYDNIVNIVNIVSDWHSGLRSSDFILEEIYQALTACGTDINNTVPDYFVGNALDKTIEVIRFHNAKGRSFETMRYLLLTDPNAAVGTVMTKSSSSNSATLYHFASAASCSTPGMQVLGRFSGDMFERVVATPKDSLFITDFAVRVDVLAEKLPAGDGV